MARSAAPGARSSNQRAESDTNVAPPAFVTTRYQGSKQRLIPFLDGALRGLSFDSAVDVFGGTGAVSHYFKRLGKAVHYNDVLAANAVSAVALVENATMRVERPRASAILVRDRARRYARFIERTFEDVFYLPHENRWLDVVAQNAAAIEDRFERALVQHALFQACLMKRPFNLFHRKNLSVRTARVARSFGNKTTWERPFEDLFFAALDRANNAVFDNGRTNTVSCLDAFSCPLDGDLVYLDPPYVRADGASFSYRDGYHFLEGLIDYRGWPARIDKSKKHLPYDVPRSVFEDPKTIVEALDELFVRSSRARYVVLSYRRDGLPSIDAVVRSLERLGREVRVHEQPAAYALSRRATADVLVVAARGLVRGTSID
ncbi:MAG: DNA methyltransferase [Polyangiaceae bacterium]|nr:DNA methyltransferase [Polyangiaceae bacterium]